MIKSEGKTANKKLRIYRPDVSLPTICNTNGPAIVRKMIPCFPSLPEEGVFESTSLGNSFKSPKDPKFSFIYGVNVRTPRVNKILPFSTTYKYDKKLDKGQILDDFAKKFIKQEIKYKVPKFTDDYQIREILLYAPLIEVEDGVAICDKDVVILSLTTDKQLKKREYAGYIRRLKKDLCRTDGFFAIQVNALGIKERAYMWLTSEDYNVNTGGDALSNIIAISDDFDAIELYIRPHRLDFINLLFLIKARYLFDTEIAQRNTAIASAKAAIMSRNMSHNLGSHVMAYLKQHLNSVQDMVKDNVLSSLYTAEDDITTPAGIEKWCKRCEKIIKEQTEGLSEVALPFLVGLGKFISYLQERQDFIATIATNYVPYLSTVNFKDFIYDELNPDLRYARHKDRIGLQPDNILLGNIARSEGLARETNPTKGKQMSDIVLKYRHFDGAPVNDEDGNPLTKDDVADIDDRIADLENMRDFMIHLPGGVVGRQAVFSIVENIIRNAAKHGKWGDGKNKKLELTFDRFYLEDIEKGVAPDYVPEGEDTIDVFFKKYYAAAKDINDLCIVTLTDNMSFEKNGTHSLKCDNLWSIRKALIEPYIDKDTVEMLQTNKGIKEMRISAAWMRGIDDDVKINPLYITNDFNPEKSDDKEDFWIQIAPQPLSLKATAHEKKEYNEFEYKYWSADETPKNRQWVGIAPVLMVRACAKTPSEDYHLQYVFCLPKPKEVAIVLSHEKWNEWGKKRGEYIREEFRHSLASLSWAVFDVDTYLKANNKSYEFIIVDDSIPEESIERVRMTSPNRIFLQKEVSNILNIEDELINGDQSKISRSYLKNKKVDLFKTLCAFNQDKDKITISDAKTKLRIPSFNEALPKNVVIEDGATNVPFLYRTHNETELLFSEYLDATQKYNDVCFVEGITGNNSTDRLVRNETLDELWLYSHLHAMKTTVGVFDERIFSKIYKKDEADIVLRPLNELKKRYYAEIHKNNARDSRLIEIKKAKTYDDLSAAIGISFYPTLGDYMAIAYEIKGVSIFNIVKTDDGLDIYGYGGKKRFETQVDAEDGSKKVKVTYRSIIEKVGEIKKVDGIISINKLKDIKAFDYITIHQGLLDKIYEQFGIRRDAYKKHAFTKLFYEQFCSHDTVIQYMDPEIKEGPVYYLPNLRIHSGRSKPSFADMPQHQPFMQYSAIEHAIMDCKYSLIELLDFARYERDNSDDDL